MDAKLCYIEGAFAYFTTQKNQTGDDWNDTPYWCNAGPPYGETIQVVFMADLWTPADDGECVSVDYINEGNIPWLYPKWGFLSPQIYAGTTLPEFIKLIEEAGGEVFLSDRTRQSLTDR